jgi:hypothetical protein
MERKINKFTSFPSSCFKSGIYLHNLIKIRSFDPLTDDRYKK